MIPALSIRPPWADQIFRPTRHAALGQKWCENRTWSTPYRGRLLIHRSGPGGAIVGDVQLLDVIDSYGRDDETPQQAIRRLRRTVRTIYRAAGLPAPTAWSCADLFCGSWWLLAHPVRYPAPVPCPGWLRLWQPSSRTQRQLRIAAASDVCRSTTETSAHPRPTARSQ